MWTYRISGRAFQSNVCIPELKPVQTDETALSVRLFDHAVRFSRPAHWFNHWYTPDGAAWLSFAKVDAGYWLQFSDLVDFIVSMDAGTVAGYPQADVPQQTIHHLLLNQVLPVVLSHRGATVLHASACVMPQGAAAFMGVGGMGKSTLAASLGLQGYPIITDDCLLIEERAGATVGFPSYAGSRLWEESIAALRGNASALQPVAHYTDKQRLILTQEHISEPVTLSAIYVLAEPAATHTSEVHITPMETHAAFLECMKHTFQLDITDRVHLGRIFRSIEQLAKSAPFFRLTYPRDFAIMPRLHSAIKNHLGRLASSQTVAGRELTSTQ